MPALLGNINRPEYLLTQLFYFIFFPIGYTPFHMKILIRTFLLFSLLLGLSLLPDTAFAQSKKSASADLSNALSRLKNNPRYNGRVLGTHLRKTGKGYVYEVRILRPNDSVVVVYISSETGGVIGDSERSRGKNKKKKKRN